MKTSLLCFKDKAGYGFGAIAENNMQNALPMMAMPKMVKARDIPTERLSASAIGGMMTELMP